VLYEAARQRRAARTASSLVQESTPRSGKKQKGLGS
jgi:hypothetical protein